jgi:hypothetical protein
MFRGPKLPKTCHKLIVGASTVVKRDIMPTDVPIHALMLISPLQLHLPPTRGANSILVAVEEAQEAPDVVIGRFFINDTSVVVLFDSRALHSFISATYVGKHNLPLALLKCQMIVSSPGGDMPARQLCPKVNLKPRG